MRPGPLREAVVMEIEADRVHSGSVSPPAPSILTMDSMNGKKAFFELMRQRYADDQIPDAELQKKIELLWKSLSQAQKEQFILKSRNASNTSIPIKAVKKGNSQSEAETETPQVGKTENCKAIAKVLDLQGANQKSRFADTVKKHMKAYSNEVFVSKRMPPPLRRTVANYEISAEKLRIAAETARAKRIVKAHRPAAVGTSSKSMGPKEGPKVIFRSPITVEKREQLAAKVAENQQKPKITVSPTISPSFENSQLSGAPVASAARPIRQKPPTRRPCPPVPTEPQICYAEACKMYYSTLSQATLINSVDVSNIPKLTEIVENYRVVRTFTFADRL